MSFLSFIRFKNSHSPRIHGSKRTTYLLSQNFDRLRIKGLTYPYSRSTLNIKLNMRLTLLNLVHFYLPRNSLVDQVGKNGVEGNIVGTG